MRSAIPVIVVVFVLLGLIGVVAGLYFAHSRVSCESDSFSCSLVGHQALVEFLRESGFNVQVNQRVSPPEGSRGGVAVLCPRGETERQNSWKRLNDRFQRVLFVLPKWDATPAPANPAWVSQKNLIPEGDVTNDMPSGLPRVVRPFAGGATAVSVTFADGRPAMRIHSASLQVFKPFDGVKSGFRVVASADGYPLVIESGLAAAKVNGWTATGDAATHRVWVSDPDMMSNEDLAKLDNAAFAATVFEFAFPDRSFMLDEVHHGFVAQDSLFKMIFGFPGVVLTLNAAFLVVCFYWALSRGWLREKSLRGLQRSRTEQVKNVGRLTFAHGAHHAAATMYVSSIRAWLAEMHHLPHDTNVDKLADEISKWNPQASKSARRFVRSMPLLIGANDRTGGLVTAARDAHTLLMEVRNATGKGSEAKASH
jgi:hypothetical protein